LKLELLLPPQLLLQIPQISPPSVYPPFSCDLSERRRPVPSLPRKGDVPHCTPFPRHRSFLPPPLDGARIGRVYPGAASPSTRCTEKWRYSETTVSPLIRLLCLPVLFFLRRPRSKGLFFFFRGHGLSPFCVRLRDVGSRKSVPPPPVLRSNHPVLPVPLGSEAQRFFLPRTRTGDPRGSPPRFHVRPFFPVMEGTE